MCERRWCRAVFEDIDDFMSNPAQFVEIVAEYFQPTWLCGSNILSATLSMIGWLNVSIKPGIWCSRSSMPADQILLVPPFGQAL